MDLMCGGSLRERIEQRDGVPFGERPAAHFVRQITTGLAYLHEQVLASPLVPGAAVAAQ
jgi:serine/threonine protein kinase